MHTRHVDFTWDEVKRLSNLQKHGLDFADAHRVFAGPMAVYEDHKDEADLFFEEYGI